MRKAGDVTYADAHKNRKNEGVVEFASRRDMERAIDKFDDYDLNGRRIKVSLVQFKVNHIKLRQELKKWLTMDGGFSALVSS